MTGIGLNNRNGPQSSSTFDLTNWIIVGTVLGFVGGVVAGVVVAIVVSCLRRRRRGKTLDLTRSCEITNDTNAVNLGEFLFLLSLSLSLSALSLSLTNSS